ncbi:MAG: aldose 1-epimerase family protein [Bacteroidia bacterium]|nr:aldose 1-epimerase family protein [Bacteroidia bacterium]
MKTTLTSNELTVEIKAHGAELCSIKNKQGTEFLWQASPDVWPRHAPVLFPVVGKLKNNAFSYNNNSYSLGQHGFARDKAFHLIESSDQRCTFELLSNADTKKVFPFDFIFRIHYALTQNVLVTSYQVINSGTEQLLFSVGAHPGFNCPLSANETFEDYYLEFENNQYQLTELLEGLRLEGTRQLHLSNQQVPLSKNLFDKDALVFEGGQINSVSLCSSKSLHKIKLNCANWPYFGIWSKKGCRQFVCLEPWYGIADNNNSNGNLLQKDGILKLAPKSEFSCDFSLEFH